MVSIQRLAAFADSGILITSDEAAELLGCTRGRVRQLRAEGQLQSLAVGRSGRCQVFDLAAVMAYAAAAPATGRPRRGPRMN